MSLGFKFANLAPYLDLCAVFIPDFYQSQFTNAANAGTAGSAGND